MLEENFNHHDIKKLNALTDYEGQQSDMNLCKKAKL